MVKNPVEDIYYALCVEFARPLQSSVKAGRRAVMVFGLNEAQKIADTLVRPARHDDLLWRVDFMTALIQRRPFSIAGQHQGLVNYGAALLCASFHPFPLNTEACANCNSVVQADCRAKTPVDGNICLRELMNERILKYRKGSWNDTQMLGSAGADHDKLRALLVERLANNKIAARRAGGKMVKR